MEEPLGKPKIGIFTTGGTILSQMDKKSGVVNPALTGASLLNRIREVEEKFDIIHVEFSNMPGSDLTLADGLALSNGIKRMQREEEVDGIVVLQGTDTMDEIPYFVGMTTDTDKPIVFTGAMKSNHDSYSDAAGNLLGAACVAVSASSKNRGVLVYFNETIFSAQDVYKEHASRIDAFSSQFGPIGSVINQKVHFFRESINEKVYSIAGIEEYVPLLKVSTGMDRRMIDDCVDGGAKGIVIEGYGSGNVPHFLVPAIERAISRGVVVIVATRCVFGESYAGYGYIGGGAQLKEAGVILSGTLSGIKSRIKLAVMLAAGESKDDIARAYEYH